MSDKGALQPPSTAPHAPGIWTGYEGKHHAAPATAYYPAPSSFAPPGVEFPPSSPTQYHLHSAEYNQAQQQQTTTSLVNVVSGGEPVIHNVSQVEIVRSNYVQIPNVYPGCAFCKFVPGVLETLIRLAIVVRRLQNHFAIKIM